MADAFFVVKLGDKMKNLIVLLLVLVGTTIMSQLSLRLELPTVVGQLIAGVVLGPAFLNWIQPSTFVTDLANLGVILLMFIAGLESNLQLLKRYLKPSVIVASCGVLLPMVIMPLIGEQIHLSLAKALFLGVTFSATSVSISVEVLQEMGQLKTQAGTTILGAAVADDVISVVLLSLVGTFTHENVSGSAIQNWGIWPAALCQILYFILIWWFVKTGVRILFRITGYLLVARIKAILGLLVCFGLATLAEVTGLSSITGAFFAGIAVGQTKARSAVSRQILPLGNLIPIPVFFISIGLNMTLSGIVRNWGLLIVLVIAAVLTKLFGAGIGALTCRYSLRKSAVVGAGMISRGEVALIIAQLGYQSRLLSVGIYSTVVSAVILTTILAPVMLKSLVTSNN